MHTVPDDLEKAILGTGAAAAPMYPSSPGSSLKSVSQPPLCCTRFAGKVTTLAFKFGLVYCAMLGVGLRDTSNSCPAALKSTSPASTWRLIPYPFLDNYEDGTLHELQSEVLKGEGGL